MSVSGPSGQQGHSPYHHHWDDASPTQHRDSDIKKGFHQFGQYIPFVSTLTSLHMIIDRTRMSKSKKTSLQSGVEGYDAYVARTSKMRMAVALLPFAGNLLLAGYDIGKPITKKLATIASNFFGAINHRG